MSKLTFVVLTAAALLAGCGGNPGIIAAATAPMPTQAQCAAAPVLTATQVANLNARIALYANAAKANIAVLPIGGAGAKAVAGLAIDQFQATMASAGSISNPWSTAGAQANFAVLNKALIANLGIQAGLVIGYEPAVLADIAAITGCPIPAAPAPAG